MPLDELRIYTVTPQGLEEYLRLAQDVAVPIRGDAYGSLLGFWIGEIGSVCRVFNLWRHTDLATRQQARAGLDRLEAWRNDYVARVHPLMDEQEIRFMSPVAPLRPPAGAVSAYEFRLIRTKVGKAAEIAARLRDEPPDDDPAMSLAVWTTFAGRLNEVVQLSAYPDLDRRIRSGGWRDFYNRHGASIARTESSLVTACPHSPLR